MEKEKKEKKIISGSGLRVIWKKYLNIKMVFNCKCRYMQLQPIDYVDWWGRVGIDVEMVRNKAIREKKDVKIYLQNKR